MPNISKINVGDVGYNLSFSSSLNSKSTTATTTAGEIYGIAAKTSSPYYCSRWIANLDDKTNALYDGKPVIIKVPVAGNGSYGTELSIDGGVTYHPVVTNNNTMIGTRYAVGYVLILVYDSSVSCNSYRNSASATSVSGCWKAVNDYDSGNAGNDGQYIQRNYYEQHLNGTIVNRYNILLNLDNKLYSVNTTNNTAGNKTSGWYTGKFNVFNSIYYYNSTTQITSLSSTPITFNNALYVKCLADLRYNFNNIVNSSSGLLYSNVGKPLYLKAKLDSTNNNLASLYYGTNNTDYTQCLTVTLPTSDDGCVYIYLGIIYDWYRVYLNTENQIVYKYTNGKVARYSPYGSSAIQWTTL